MESPFIRVVDIPNPDSDVQTMGKSVNHRVIRKYHLALRHQDEVLGKHCACRHIGGSVVV